MDQNTGTTDPGLGINSDAPDFEAETTEGTIHFHEWMDNSWTVLFSHPRNFTPVCTTELGYLAGIEPEFAKRGVKIIGLSVDPVENHAQWSEDIKETQGHEVTYPLIGDKDFKVAKAYGMLPAEVEGDPTTRTPAENATVRNVFVVGPDKKIKLILVYPMTTGRNFDEVLRVIDSLQLTAKHKVATPAQWQPGDDVIIAGSVSNDEATQKYPDGWETPKPYIRIVKQPGFEPAAAADAAAAAAAEPATGDAAASPEAAAIPDAAATATPDATTSPEAATTPDATTSPEAATTPDATTSPEATGSDQPAPSDPQTSADAQAEPSADAEPSFPEAGEPILGVVEPQSVDEAPAEPAGADEPSSTNGHASHDGDHTGEGADAGHGHEGHEGHDHASQSSPAGAAAVIEALDRTTRQVIAAAKPVARRLAEYIENARKK